jgi:hypothetical protein
MNNRKICKQLFEIELEIGKPTKIIKLIPKKDKKRKAIAYIVAKNQTTK